LHRTTRAELMAEITAARGAPPLPL
jgi:hypothetical protein